MGETHSRGVVPPAAANPLHAAPLESFTFTSERPFNFDAFCRWADALAPEVFRAKGFVMLESRTVLFNYAAGRWDLEEFNFDSTQLVFIGSNLKSRQDTIIGSLKECERATG